MIVTISGTPTTNSSAFDLGLISKDTNVGGVDTKSLFNCFGAAITCDNDNTVNNNISVNNGTNGNQNQTDTSIACFEAVLNQNQINAFLSQLVVDSIAEYCPQLQLAVRVSILSNL